MRVVIVGAGIGGVSTAVGLQHAGIKDVVLIEQAENLREIGAGIQMPNNGAGILEEWGLGDGLASKGIVSPASYSYDLSTDKDLLFTEAGEWGTQLYGAHFYQIRRTELLRLLTDQLAETDLKLGSRCVGIASRDDKVECRLDDESAIFGDVLIGADGIHSVVRADRFEESEASYAGFAAWRSLLRGDELTEIDLPFGTHTWFGADRSVVAYWTDDHETLNFIGIVPDSELHRESWSAEGSPQELQASFDMACARVKQIVTRVEHPFITGLYKRPTLKRWVNGRIALIGDSAHAMVPFLANGANQSIEDAHVLSQCLAKAAAGENDISYALKEFETR